MRESLGLETWGLGRDMGASSYGMYTDTLADAKVQLFQVRCNPDVAPRRTSGGYEDKVDFIAPTNILFIGGGKF